MSAYAEWKNGQITDFEYSQICRMEAYEMDHPEESDEEEEEFIDDEIDEF